MIPLPILSQLEAFLLSDRVSIKGSEFGSFAQLVGAIQAEKQAVSAISRVVRLPDDSPQPPGGEAKPDPKTQREAA